MRFRSLFSTSFLLFLLTLAVPTTGWTATYTLPADQLPGCSTLGPVVTCDGWFSLANNDIVIVTSPTTIRITEGGTLNGAQVNVGGSPANLTIEAVGQQLSMGDDAHLVGNVTARTIQSSNRENVLIEGRVILTGQLALGNQSEIIGNITAGSVDIGSNSTITGDVDVTGTLTLGRSSTINGDVEANMITIDRDATVNGNLQANDNVNLRQGATINGNINAGGSLNASNSGIAVNGDITVGAAANIGPGMQIDGHISAGANVNVSRDAWINGNIDGHSVHLAQDVLVEGSVDADGDVTTSGIIQGNVNARGDLWLNGSGNCVTNSAGRIIGGQGCVRGYANVRNADHIEQNNPGRVGGLVCNQNVNEGPCTGAGGSTVSFYRIEHGGSVLTCEPLNVQVRACADASCLTEKALNGTVNVQASGPQTFSGSGNYSNNSLVSVDMPITAPGTYTLTLTTAPEAATGPLQCQSPSGCQVTAVDSILRWSEPGQSTIRHQTAGVPFQLQVEAIRTDTNTSACVAALQGPQSLSVSLDCDDPGTCSSDGLQFSTLAGSQLTASPATSARAVTFDGNGRAQLGEMVYEDAGRIRLQAAVTAGDTSISGWSNPFAVRPARVEVEVTNTETYNNPEIFGRAGDDLTVTLSALSATGRITRNFGLESPPETLMLLPQATTQVPASGIDGVITIEQGLVLLQGEGQFTGVVRYSEAGTARFHARVASQNYLASGMGASGDEDVGRFLPWEFRVEAVGTLVEMTCSAPGFTYLGQPFETSLRLSARNRAGAVTQNYPDVGAGASATLVARDKDTDAVLSGPLETMPLALTWAAPVAGSGYGAVSTDVEMTRLPFDWQDPEKAGPFESVTIGVEIDDPFVPLAHTDFSDLSDDCTADDSCTAVTLVEDARFVYGQMVLTDTMGSEFSDLPVTLQVHYWDGERFRLHQADQCTAVYGYDSDPDEKNFAITENFQNLATDAMGPPLTEGVTLSNGLSPVGSLLLTAPHEAGEVRFTYEAPEWLKVWLSSEAESRDPSATATFGTYGGHDRIIHWRLVH